MSKGKRQYRELNEETKQKISRKLKNQHKSEAHKQAISKAMILYWQEIPNKPKKEDEVEDN